MKIRRAILHGAVPATTLLVAVLAVGGCATTVASPPSTLSPTPSEALTPPVQSIVLRAKQAHGVDYQLGVQIFAPVSGDAKSGGPHIWIDIQGEPTEIAPNVAACGYRPSTDLLIPFNVSLRIIGPGVANPSANLLLLLGAGYGLPSGDRWSDFVNRFGSIDYNGVCNIATVPDTNSEWQLDERALKGFKASDGDINVGGFLYLGGGLKLSPTDRNTLLEGVSISPETNALAPGGPVITLLTPSKTLLLQGNGCAAVFVPFDPSDSNSSWRTPAQEGCKNIATAGS
jgi:hypothetical protein